jgi:hypothetical protein
MKRAPLDYAVSLLLAPVICIITTFLVKQFAESDAAQLGSRLDVPRYEQFQAGVDLVLTLAIVVLAASILLPVLLAIFVRRLGNNRNALASAFAPLAQAYLVCVAVVLVAQGCLILFSTYQMFVSGVMRSGLILFVLGALGLGVLAAAFAVLSDIRRMLERPPLQVTGALVDSRTWPALHKRIAGVASRLKVVPDQVVISLAPQTFATAGAVRLRGEGELGEGVTLCVSAPELRVLAESELDAALAAALGALSDEDVSVSRKLIPSYRSLVECVAFFEEDDPESNRWFKYARIPANGFLAALVSSSRAAMRKVAAQRRSVERGAAIQASSANSWAAGLAKATVLHARWNVFRSAYDAYMLRGQTRALADSRHAGCARRTEGCGFCAACSRSPHYPARERLLPRARSAHEAGRWRVDACGVVDGVNLSCSGGDTGG